MNLFGPGGKAEWIVAPNTAADNAATASRATHHGDFDDDTATVQATLARILNKTESAAALSFAASGQRRRDMRRKIEQGRNYASGR